MSNKDVHNEQFNYSIRIGWLYPELMSTYGDRGNVFVLQQRLLWRNIGVTILPISFETAEKEITGCDLIFGGGAQDRQQGILVDDLRNNKKHALITAFTRGVPGLFVCGSPQLLGHSYMTGDGKKLTGLGIFDMESRHFGQKVPRCIGNTVGTLNSQVFEVSAMPRSSVVGFENHGGRTYLGHGVVPFATVVTGHGNNSEDKTEGAIFHNCIACYYHGPFLPRNPHIADWLLARAIFTKYGKNIPLTDLDDGIEWQAHDAHVARFVT